MNAAVGTHFKKYEFYGLHNFVHLLCGNAFECVRTNPPDDGTAICKAAADYFDIPTNQYFQTTSIDVNGGFQNVSNALCAVAGGTAQNGSNAVHYSGTIMSTGLAVACFKAIAVSIPVDEKMTLSYSINPQSTLGRFAGVDLAMTDGSTLHAAGALDTAGVRRTACCSKTAYRFFSTGFAQKRGLFYPA